MGISSLDIKNQLFMLPASIINILDFDSKKLSIQKKLGEIFIMIINLLF